MKMKLKMTMENKKKLKSYMIYMQYQIILVDWVEDIIQLMLKTK